MVEMMTHDHDELVRAMRARGFDIPALRAAMDASRPPVAVERGVLALSRSVLPVADAAAAVVRGGEPVVLGHLAFEDLDAFRPIAVVELPRSDAYVCADVDLGADLRGVTPEDALVRILAAGRSPLTLDEGIALILQQPEAIARNQGFSMAGSRRGDQRVSAWWISEGRPKLGWCWDRNPHDWLGTASCAARIATV